MARFIKIMILCSVTLLITLTGCGTKEVESNGTAVSSSDSVTLFPAVPSDIETSAVKQSVVTAEVEKIEITLYLFGPDDYNNPIEKKVILVNKELYENNMSEALNYVFEETKIRINSIEVDKEANCITVDISQEVAMQFNAGSTAASILTKELLNTILNLPDIQSAIITVDGEKDSWSDHYSFKGTFTKDKTSGENIRK